MAAKSKKLAPAAAVAESIEAAAPVVPAVTTSPFAASSFAPVLPALGEFADLGRDNLAALTQANKAFADGMQAIGKEVMTYARSSFETASRTATALLSAKTLDEVIELQTGLAKASLEIMMARSAKLSEMGLAVASETMAPLGGRVEATLEKLAKPIAA